MLDDFIQFCQQTIKDFKEGDLFTKIIIIVLSSYFIIFSSLTIYVIVSTCLN